LAQGMARISSPGGAARSRGRGTGFPGLTGANGSVCVMVCAREVVRLTRRVRGAPGTVWQRLREGKGAGRFGEMGWARRTVEIGRLGENGS
jgi:hypothetical protein